MQQGKIVPERPAEHPQAELGRVAEVFPDGWCTGRWVWAWGIPDPMEPTRRQFVTPLDYTDYDPELVAQVQRARHNHQAEGVKQ